MTLLLTWALAAGAAGAMTPRPDPADPQAAVAPARHVSAIRPPRPAAPPADWKQANDAVLKAGGWKAYARETAASEPKR